MAKSDYLVQNDLNFSTQLSDFKNAIGSYSAVLGLTPDQLASQAADADYFASVLATMAAMRSGSIQWTSWKTALRADNSLAADGAPAPPVFPPAVVAVGCGIEARFRALVRLIKAAPAYNAAIGKALGIEGPDHSGPDFQTIAPILTARISGGRVQIGWGWQGHGGALDLIEIQVDRGNGEIPLTYDTTPGYTDPEPLPAAPAKWTYKAIYRKGDTRIGQWSTEVSLIVGG